MASVEDAGTGDERRRARKEDDPPKTVPGTVTPARCGSRRTVRVPINAHRSATRDESDRWSIAAVGSSRTCSCGPLTVCLSRPTPPAPVKCRTNAHRSARFLGVKNRKTTPEKSALQGRRGSEGFFCFWGCGAWGAHLARRVGVCDHGRDVGDGTDGVHEAPHARRSAPPSPGSCRTEVSGDEMGFRATL